MYHAVIATTATSTDKDTSFILSILWKSADVIANCPVLSVAVRPCVLLAHHSSAATSAQSNRFQVCTVPSVRFLCTPASSRLPDTSHCRAGFTPTSWWGVRRSLQQIFIIFTVLSAFPVRVVHKRFVDVRKTAKVRMNSSFSGVVNLCEEWNGNVALYETLGIRHLHVPTLDLCEPTIPHAEAAVAVIHDHLQRFGCCGAILSIDCDVTPATHMFAEANLCTCIARLAKAALSLSCYVTWCICWDSGIKPACPHCCLFTLYRSLVFPVLKLPKPLCRRSGLE